MEDQKIVDLYWERQESALLETQKKYGRHLFQLAYRILGNREDSAESVNEAYLKAWGSIPPQRPIALSPYLGKLARRAAIDCRRRRTREKRRGTEYALSLSELEECLPAEDTPERQADLRLLSEAVNRYLRSLPEEKRALFIGRYYHLDSLQEAAAYCGMSQSKAKGVLYRIRCGLKAYLEQEGF